VFMCVCLFIGCMKCALQVRECVCMSACEYAFICLQIMYAARAWVVCMCVCVFVS